MKRDKKFKKGIINRYSVSAVVALIALVGVSSVLILRYNGSAAASNTAAAISQSTSSQFSFTGAAQWSKGPTNKTSMALFSDSRSRECFTSIEHKSSTVDVTTVIQKQKADLQDTGNTMTALASTTATLKVNTALQHYELYQFNISSSDTSQKLMGGLALGFIQLSNGYLKIQGHCNSSDELTTIIPAIQAYEFDASK